MSSRHNFDKNAYQPKNLITLISNIAVSKVWFTLLLLHSYNMKHHRSMSIFPCILNTYGLSCSFYLSETAHGVTIASGRQMGIQNCDVSHVSRIMQIRRVVLRNCDGFHLLILSLITFFWCMHFIQIRIYISL